MTTHAASKQHVHDFWNDASCGERLYLSGLDRGAFAEQARVRYKLEPYIADMARFEESCGKRVLEIGVGLGADHQRFAEAGAALSGIDLTERAVTFTRARFETLGLPSDISVGDAECLAFPDHTFDIVYSWGVLHHSPDTGRAIREVHRVLKPGGKARVMIYHKWSMVGLMLWTRYALLRARPWQTLAHVYANHLESPGTKAYTVREARELFAEFSVVRVQTLLSHGDLLSSNAGQRHRGAGLRIAKALWPRRLIQRLTPRLGLFMFIEATK